MDQLLLPVFSDAMLLAACKLSCSVRDEPSYVTTDMGSVESHVVAPTATKNRECEIHDIDCIEPMKDGSNNQPASVHEGALSQFLDIWSNSPLQEENCQASPSLRAAVLKQQMENMSILEKESPKKMETPMEELEEYHLQCRGNETRYYDAFKQKQRGNVDFQANLKRLELAGWWDEIIQYKFDEDELPDDIQCRKEWIIWFTQHRPLVEPLDIANYCRLGKKEDSGFYGRPSRYRTCGWKSMMRTSNGKHPRRSLRTGVSGHMLKNLRA